MKCPVTCRNKQADESSLKPTQWAWCPFSHMPNPAANIGAQASGKVWNSVFLVTGGDGDSGRVSALVSPRPPWEFVFQLLAQPGCTQLRHGALVGDVPRGLGGALSFGGHSQPCLFSAERPAHPRDCPFPSKSCWPFPASGLRAPGFLLGLPVWTAGSLPGPCLPLHAFSLSACRRWAL